ncbi:hypothetical protein GCM10027079_25530 [Sediminivirga luteola]|uniref:Uncharacterized protein n=1 Tax=Sediminivirga luteola TaxID=1774748 RepID=A0A8J2XMH6_9MICO|nr:hypothetical protein GCM10011333_31800 [Sediminivirga luteola]
MVPGDALGPDFACRTAVGRGVRGWACRQRRCQHARRGHDGEDRREPVTPPMQLARLPRSRKRGTALSVSVLSVPGSLPRGGLEPGAALVQEVLHALERLGAVGSLGAGVQEHVLFDLE